MTQKNYCIYLLALSVCACVACVHPYNRQPSFYHLHLQVLSQWIPPYHPNILKCASELTPRASLKSAKVNTSASSTVSAPELSTSAFMWRLLQRNLNPCPFCLHIMPIKAVKTWKTFLFCPCGHDESIFIPVIDFIHLSSLTVQPIKAGHLISHLLFNVTHGVSLRSVVNAENCGGSVVSLMPWMH